MNNKLDIFKYQGKEVRVVKGEHGDAWWVAKDVCEILGLGNSWEAVSRLDNDEKKNTVSLNDGTPGNPIMTIINESGLYSLIIRSDKPEAKKFRRWITHIVLPAIRKAGGLSMAAQVPETFADALRLAAKQQDEIEKQKKQLAIASPKAEFYDTISV